VTLNLYNQSRGIGSWQDDGMKKTLGIPPLVQLLLVCDILLIAVGLRGSAYLRIVLPYGESISVTATVLPVFVYAMAEGFWVFSLAGWGAYDPRRVLRWYQEAGRVVAGAATGTMFLAGALYLSFRELSRLQFVYFLLLTVTLLLGARAVLRIYFRLVGRSRPGWRNRVLIVGAGDLGRKAAEVLIDQSRLGYSLMGFLDDDPGKQGQSLAGHRVLSTIDRVSEITGGSHPDEVWICLPGRSYERIQWVVAQLERQPVRIKIAPDFFSLALVQARAEIVGGIPFIGLREPLIEGPARFWKRTFDLLGGLVLLLLLGLPMACIALAIRLNSSGAALFRQRRVGENLRPFDMLKFRTMVAGAEAMAETVTTLREDGSIVHKHRDDPRVTSVGRFLRRYSLDELPQLFNVLSGEMSLVGPRPELPWLVDRYEPWQRRRFAVPQGMTGWWQINGRSDKPMHLNTDDDLYYVYNYSLWLDIKILLRTPWAILQGRGAF
jgi:exopolysaccharide biosynthesis polyprenyl glycosylphosphotransferase